MFTSENELSRNRAFQTAWAYLIGSLVCLFFGMGYEACSHGVYSPFMIYAFAFPLVGGVLPFLWMASHGFSQPSPSWCFYHAGIATWTVGSILQGVMDIFGTNSGWLLVYWWVGGIMLAMKLVLQLLKQASHPKESGT